MSTDAQAATADTLPSTPETAAEPSTPPRDPIAVAKLGIGVALSLAWWTAGIMQGQGGWMLNLVFAAGTALLLYRLTLVGALLHNGGAPIPRLWLGLLLPFTPFAPPPAQQPAPPPVGLRQLLHTPYLALALVALGAAFWLGWSQGLERWLGHAFLDDWDNHTGSYLEHGLKSASVILLTGELLHGLMATIQHLTLSLAPFGFGFNISVGQLVAPIDDVLVRFNDIMIAATASLGIQKLLLALAQKIVFPLVIPLAAGVWVLSLLPSPSSRFLRQLAMKMLVVGLFVRLAIPAIAQVGQQADDWLLAQEQQRAQGAIEGLARQVDDDSQGLMGDFGIPQAKQVDQTMKLSPADLPPQPLPPPAATPAPAVTPSATAPAAPAAPAASNHVGFFDKIKNAFHQASQEVKEKIASDRAHIESAVKKTKEATQNLLSMEWAKDKKEELLHRFQQKYLLMKAKMEQIKEKMFHLVVVTLIQVIVLPLLTLWLMKVLMTWVAGPEQYARFEEGLLHRKEEIDRMRTRLWGGGKGAAHAPA